MCPLKGANDRDSRGIDMSKYQITFENNMIGAINLAPANRWTAQ